MTKFYLLDDDASVTDILKIILEGKGLGTVCGMATSPEDALDDVIWLRPDIVIADLLMPDMDGITFVRKAMNQLPDTAFIMLSQVSSKDMVAEAYDAGVRYFVQKPVNAIEVQKVAEHVIREQTLERKMRQMQSMMADVPGGNVAAGGSPADGPVGSGGMAGGVGSAAGVGGAGGSAADYAAGSAGPAGSAGSAGLSGLSGLSGLAGNMPDAAARSAETVRARIRSILQELGLIGAVGYDDIVRVVERYAYHEEEMSRKTVKKICEEFSDTPKSMEQRIRRTAAAALSTIANIGLEDYSSEIFTEYSGTLFDFEQVRKEMDYLQGKSHQRGNVKIRKFLLALVSLCSR